MLCPVARKTCFQLVCAKQYIAMPYNVLRRWPTMGDDLHDPPRRSLHAFGKYRLMSLSPANKCIHREYQPGMMFVAG